MILELRNNLHEGAKTENRTSNDAPVVSLDDWSEANNGPALTILEFFDLLANNVSNRPGIGIQYVTGGNNEFVSSRAATSPLEVGFVGTSYGVSTGSNSHGNGEVTFLGFQNQTSSGFDVDNIADADLNPSKWVCDADQVFSYFYAGFEKKDKYNPDHKQVQRERSQEGSRSVDEQVKACNQGIDHDDCASANHSSHGSVFEILHELSLTEEEVG